MAEKRVRKAKIPVAIREQTWLTYFGKCYKHKCYVWWCKNTIDVFNFHVGHNVPESVGGSLDISNLRPICSRCNQSMGNRMTIEEWADLSHKPHIPPPPPRPSKKQSNSWSKYVRNMKFW